MKTIMIVFAAALAAASLAGCGGGSNSNPFMGVYSGPATDTTWGSGTMSMVVAASGNLAGSFTPTGSSTAEVVSGTITSSGNASIEITAPSGITGAPTVNDSGLLTLTSTTGVLSGTLTGTATTAVAPPNNTSADTLTVNLTL